MRIVVAAVAGATAGCRVQRPDTTLEYLRILFALPNMSGKNHCRGDPCGRPRMADMGDRPSFHSGFSTSGRPYKPNHATLQKQKKRNEPISV